MRRLNRATSCLALPLLGASLLYAGEARAIDGLRQQLDGAQRKADAAIRSYAQDAIRDIAPATDVLAKLHALLQRLHLLDHRTQIKKLRASLAATSAQAKGTATRI